MPISWNEIKSRAATFSKEWSDTVREEADAKPFLVKFLEIFGIPQKRVATFEHRVKKLDDSSGYIDMLWPGTLLVEMKSRGQDLQKAYEQAIAYCHGLKNHELPTLILISDFHYFHVYHQNGDIVKFELPQLVEYVHLFEELAGYQKRTYHEEDPVNIAAAELMGKLHDQLKDVGYTGAHLEAYLVRLLFILFADDSTIFQKGIFYDYLIDRTLDDGSDLAMHMDQLFQVLDTAENKRLKTLDEQLNAFPYVNGRLFSVRLPTAAFDTKMRGTLLECCKLDWGKISPAIFGSLFQSVMDSIARRNLGAHYTSEKNIMKLIKPLFLDELWEEFHTVGDNHNKLRQLHSKISKLRFLDPACGCGNFLITAFRELRLLELAIVEKLLKGQMVTNINQYFLVDLDQFYGIEIGEFPSQIAQVAMFLIDHQCNMLVSEKFGEYIPLIPLQKSAVIVNDNALKIEWQSIIQPLAGETDAPRFHYILGNPPFVGTAYQDPEQKSDMARIFQGARSYGMLDYVTAWYLKAAQYMQQHFMAANSINTKTAFVSTNSISQGEQVSLLWNELFKNYSCKIHFAHRTFKWSNEAKGVAAVHVVIIGFSNFDIAAKKLYSHNGLDSSPEVTICKNINPYLVEGSDNFLQSISSPICNAPKMQSGSAARDGGFLILSDYEKVNLTTLHPELSTHIRRFISGDDIINNIQRWCLWFKGSDLKSVRHNKELQERFEGVKQFRLSSTRQGTKKMAAFPYLFAEERQPSKDFLLIPKVSSERRSYIPIAYLDKSNIVSDKTFVVPDTSLFHFGVLTSMMHNTWMRFTCGRMKSDYSYSNTIVYNNFPWPEAPSGKEKQVVEAAQSVLDARAKFPESSLADLYDPNTMPPVLVKAHQQLDKAVDKCYRSQPFNFEAKRIEFLFELYEKYISGLFPAEKLKKSKKGTN